MREFDEEVQWCNMVKKVDEMKRSTYLLNSLERSWREVPTVYKELDSWEEMAALDYVVDEIPSMRRLTLELDRMHERGELTAEEEVRYHALKKVVAENDDLADKMERS